MGRTKTQVREDVGGCSRLRDMSANLDQVGFTFFLFAFARSCFSGAPFQMIEGICVFFQVAKVVFPVLVLIFYLVYFSTALNFSQEQYAGFMFLNKSEI